MNKNDPKEVGRAGGLARWAKIKDKKKRSELMKKVSQSRFKKSKDKE